MRCIGPRCVHLPAASVEVQLHHFCLCQLWPEQPVLQGWEAAGHLHGGLQHGKCPTSSCIANNLVGPRSACCVLLQRCIVLGPLPLCVPLALLCLTAWLCPLTLPTQCLSLQRPMPPLWAQGRKNLNCVFKDSTTKGSAICPVADPRDGSATYRAFCDYSA